MEGKTSGLDRLPLTNTGLVRGTLDYFFGLGRVEDTSSVDPRQLQASANVLKLVRCYRPCARAEPEALARLIDLAEDPSEPYKEMDAVDFRILANAAERVLRTYEDILDVFSNPSKPEN